MTAAAPMTDEEWEEAVFAAAEAEREAAQARADDLSYRASLARMYARGYRAAGYPGIARHLELKAIYARREAYELHRALEG